MAIIVLCIGIQKKYTFTLSEPDGNVIKSEQIQPLLGRVKVSGNCDTDVIFTDVKTNEKYIIGYITPGMTERIELPRNRWYTVTGAGDITVGPVNVRIE